MISNADTGQGGSVREPAAAQRDMATEDEAPSDGEIRLSPGVSGETELSPRIERLAGLTVDDERIALLRVAAATRDIIEYLTSTATPTADLVSAADQLEAISELLARYRKPRPYEGIAELANAGELFANHPEKLAEFSAQMVATFDHSPFIGLSNPLSPPVELRVQADRVVGSVNFGSAYEGPPGCVHGGYIAAVFDELLGSTQSLSGAQGMTAALTINYRSPTPLRQTLDLEAVVERHEGRKITCVGWLRHGDVVCAEAEALFVAFDRTGFLKLLQDRNAET